jgi:hypothetical protein
MYSVQVIKKEGVLFENKQVSLIDLVSFLMSAVLMLRRYSMFPSMVVIEKKKSSCSVMW